MGIYIHVPFCRNKCFYCGFYSVASLRLKEMYLAALQREMEIRRDYLAGGSIQTVYFGGGTPSLLEVDELEMILNKLHSIWTLSSDAEYSIEINPEDATPEKLQALRQIGFNRLTIGIQSFDNAVLKRINRHHTAEQAIRAVENAQGCGFDNVGIDLIIGLPGSCTADLEKELRILKHLFISHLSVYILSIDSDSVFEKLSHQGKLEPPDDDRMAEQYLMISDYMKGIGYEHYEISNFAKDGKYSRHNTAYWQQKPYIGLGPSAHSYNRDSRQWNTSHLKTYIDSLNENCLSFEKEILTKEDQFNEYLMTRLRTMWGADVLFLEKEFGSFWQKAAPRVASFRDAGWLVPAGQHLRLTERGWLVSDGIFRELFV